MYNKVVVDDGLVNDLLSGLFKKEFFFAFAPYELKHYTRGIKYDLFKT